MIKQMWEIVTVDCQLGLSMGFNVKGWEFKRRIINELSPSLSRKPKLDTTTVTTTTTITKAVRQS